MTGAHHRPVAGASPAPATGLQVTPVVGVTAVVGARRVLGVIGSALPSRSRAYHD